MPSEVLTHTECYDIALAQNEGLGQTFRSHVVQRASSMAITDEHAMPTCGALHSRVALLAKELCREHFLREEPVGIVVQRETVDIVTQMAILYAGGTCDPMDPALPDPQIQSRLPPLRGACVAVLSKSVLLDPPTLAHIERRNITVMVTSTALLNLAASTYPRVFENYV